MNTDSHDYETRDPGTGRGTSERSNGLDRLTERLTDYLRTRTSEHWVMFLAGIVLGSLLG